MNSELKQKNQTADNQFVNYFNTVFNKPSETQEERSFEKATVIIDEKEGIRVLNPKFKTNQSDIIQESYTHKNFSQVLLKSFESSPEREILGYHETPESPYQWITCKEFLTKIDNFAAGLHNEINISSGSQSKVGIYAINCIEWLVTHYALYLYSNVAVPLYSTLGNEAIVHIIGHTKMKTCVVMNVEKAEQLLDILTKDKSNALEHLKTIVIMRISSEENLNNLKFKYNKIQIFTMDGIMKIGSRKRLLRDLPEDDQTYIMNFTSGTTGVPKGVLITGTMVKHLLISVQNTEPVFKIFDGEITHFSFLPLAHVLEQIITNNGKIGYYSGDILKIMNEIQILKPTILVLVPRLLVKLYTEAMKIFDQYYIPMNLLNYAIKAKLAAINNAKGPVNNTIWDLILFRKLRNVIGGGVKTIITGSSACPADVLDFSRAAFGANLFVGYGATETCGVISITFPESTDPHNVGVPLEGIQVKLGDVPDMNLFPSKNNGLGRGEVLTKSQLCTKGYYEQPEKTRELIDRHGWIHTGDVGEWDEFGHLRIVERCKNIFKLSQGEYVAPEKVENIYIMCPFVEQVFLDGRSEEFYAIVLVYPKISALEEHFKFKMVKEGEETNETNLTMKQICSDKKISTFILEEMNDIGRSKNLSGFELAKKIHLMSEPMTIENYMLTSTLKPVRGSIREKYAQVIDQMYSTR